MFHFRGDILMHVAAAASAVAVGEGLAASDPHDTDAVWEEARVLSLMSS